MMDRVNQILANPQYQYYFQKIQSLEVDRKFCGHTMEHFLAVARLSFIMVCEVGLEIDKEVIYATALLHDMGRGYEGLAKDDHHEGSAIIAREILGKCGFDETEEKTIIRAIKEHRTMSDKDDFSAIFYRADKLSRNCFACPVENECNWPDKKKNMRVIL